MRNYRFDRKSTHSAFLAALLSTFSGIASAQTSQSTEADSDVIDVITVTGTRRESDVQKVPIAIDVVSSAEIEASGFASPSDLQFLVPAVGFNPEIGAGFTIRGLGSQGFDYNIEQAVSVVIDDVAQGMPRSIGMNTLADVERVEVMKGPQGTLFGKNATAGVIYIVTRKPELDAFSMLGNVRYGTDNESRIENTVNLPLSSTMAARLTGVFKQRDGYLPNRFTGQDAGGYEDTALRAKFLWQPTSDLEVYLIGEFQDHRNDGTNTIENITTFIVPDPPVSPTANDYQILGEYGIVFGPDNREFAENDPTTQTVRHDGIQGTITYQLGDYTLTSVTAFKTQDSSNRTDGDKTQSDWNKFNVNELEGDQFSQEIRLNSPVGEFLEYVLGAYYFDQAMEARENQGGLRGRTDLPPNTYVGTMGGSQYFTSTSESFAVFGEASLHLTDWATAILGGRYTDDEVGGSYSHYDDPRFNFVGNIPAPITGSQTADDFTIKALLQIQPTDNIMLYGGFTEGYKAPAIGTASGTLRPVRPERVDAYEIGMKGTFLDRRLSLNVALFQQDFEDMQTTTIVFQPDQNFETILTNAEGVDSDGIEVDATFHATADLSLGARYTYNSVEYKEFFDECYPGQPVSPEPGPGNCYDTPGGEVYDLSGLESLNAPETSFNVSFNYDPQITDRWRLIANANYSHRASQYAVAGNPNTVLPSRGILNARLGVGTLDESVRLSIYARNLLDEEFPARIRPLGFSGPGNYRTTWAIEGQRTIGVSVDYAF